MFPAVRALKMFQEPRPDGGALGANSCEHVLENSAESISLPGSRNYSLPLGALGGWCAAACPFRTLCHHAGVLLLSYWMDDLSSAGFHPLMSAVPGSVQLARHIAKIPGFY